MLLFFVWISSEIRLDSENRRTKVILTNMGIIEAIEGYESSELTIGNSERLLEFNHIPVTG